MTAPSSNGWDHSANGWIAAQGSEGDFGRRYVLDAPMIERVRRQPFRTALDVGCGEGRFCRIMRDLGLQTIGIDPTEALIDRARELDPDGDYRLGAAETLDLDPESFDLVVSYLSLIDIDDLGLALQRMTACLKPGGTLLIANLNSFATAAGAKAWIRDSEGQERFALENYLEERAVWLEWQDIRIRNWHRPMMTYMQCLLENGLQLRHFDEPAPHGGGDPARVSRQSRVPFFHIMEWQKPEQ
ncbi:methyltransferase domain-containing protein [Tianweitania sp. BSSL-BM11]|uniref:Methyltransferase domain-containing protein n=1 Tax=Tianweitania aestuarii TaxID=2814886 RepID=A0ABS5RR02_9HYPH|nr:class I SAM-dependent methyltransferase [Tianweitania aestuarii]MBS9719210.1 methyltransferase domain-containing protein [Tianweitania aestuarii]